MPQPARQTAPRLNAFCTLVTSDSYLAGALVAVHSLYDVEGPSPEVPFETVCLVTPATVSVETIRALRQAFSLVVGVDAIRTNSIKELNLLGRQDLGAAMTKLHLWRLVQFRKVIYLDADTLVLQPLSHLFSLDAPFAAAPDQGWPDCFNTGVMVCTPSAETFDAILALNEQGGSWDGADQGLLNDFFEDKWQRLSFTYNVTPSAYYQFQPAYRRHGNGIRLVHFIGLDKPWHRLNRHRSVPSTSAQAANDYFGLLDRWFDVYERHFGQLSTAAVSQTLPASTASAFVVPTLAAAWDSPSGGQLAYRPPSPEQLKTMFGGAASSLGSALASRHSPEGLYASMPHHGRSDFLSTPSPPPKAPSPTPDPNDGRGASPAPAAPGTVWDGRQGPPPQDSSPASWQMREPIQHHYENIWDQHGSHDAAGFFRPPRYAPPPDNVRGQYQATPSDPTSVRPVFPWENKSSHKPKRIFPEEGQPSRYETRAPVATSPPMVATDPARPNLQYTNAWDAISGIRRYAQGLKQPAPGNAAPPTQPPPKQTSGGPSSPTKTRGDRQPNSPPSSAARRSRLDASAAAAMSAQPGSYHARRSSDYEQGGEASSRDGDDEDDEDDEEAATEVNVPRKPRRPSAPKPLSGPSRPVSAARPHIRRDNGSYGSVTRLPTVGGMQSLVDVGAASSTNAGLIPTLAADASLTAADVKRTSSGAAAARSKAARQPASSQPTAAQPRPPQPASRIFDPSTSSDIIRREGLESLQRFVKNMEAKGEAAAATNATGAAAPRSNGSR